jgi:hypothetical protein
VQSEQVAHGSIPYVVHQIGEGSLASRGIDPLLQGAGWQITVVVNEGRPTWHDIQACISISSYRGVEGPERVRVAEQWTCVVTDDIEYAIIHPPLNDVCVVEARDGRRDDARVTPAFRRIKTDLLEPGPVEGNLFRRIGICPIGQVGMGATQSQFTS